MPRLHIQRAFVFTKPLEIPKEHVDVEMTGVSLWDLGFEDAIG